jgi:DNA-directed RNA polymerase subunit RPC12/RpoP
MANFYCDYCGTKHLSVQSLTSGTCPRHPNGVHKGHHALYQGTEKQQYLCKYCGTKHSSIQSLTGSTCPRHPDGVHKGRHNPAL